MEAKVSPSIARKKALLLAGGPVRIPTDFRIPFPVSRSTAGPGAGSTSVVFSFGNTRAKKEISRQAGDFELFEKDGSLSIHKNGGVFIEDVELIPTLLHAPYQAFVNLGNECVLECKFCASPRLEKDVTKNLTDEKIIASIIEASRKTDFRAVAFTSAIPESASLTVRRMANLVREVRRRLPDAPVGVEPYATRPDEVEMLRDAGADEIKLNIESYDRDIFEKVCPNRDYDSILHSINHACEVFGKNRVCSNIIFGLGEADDTVLEGARVLANMGAVATLRSLRLNRYNRTGLEKALGVLQPVDADRMLRLAKAEKKILKEYGLTTLAFKTMCHSCLSCDIVPFWDV
jgi:biotin synthase-related radical SAM superfamily protein